MSVSIRLTRNAYSKNDDIIIIRKRMHHPDFLVRYTDPNMEGHVWVLTKTLDQIMVYLRRTFMYLNKERDPFHGIQCTIPGYPVVYLPIPEFNPEMQVSVLDSIYETLSRPPAMFHE